MTIITVPHPTLREVAQSVTTVDAKLLNFIKELATTLKNTREPQGVGLAAPQVNKAWQIFATYLPEHDDTSEKEPSILRTFINPKMLDHGEELVFGPDPENPRYEGCLSIPKVYGPVPRFKDIILGYDEIVDGELVPRQLEASDFRARVIQHEFDHLQGVLFTDYSLEYDLPVYREDKNGKLIEIDKRILESF